MSAPGNLTVHNRQAPGYDFAQLTGDGPLRLCTHNAQVGIDTRQPSDYLTKSHKHILPCPMRQENLDHIAAGIRDFHFVGFQELDAGSIRSQQINQTAYLAQRADFPFWASRVNRNLGKLGQHALGICAGVAAIRTQEIPLPGRIPGRGALITDFQWHGAPLRIINSHLSLGKRTRALQMKFLGALCDEVPYCIVMADFNCSPEMGFLPQWCEQHRLQLPEYSPPTYPRWRPKRAIDHIIVSRSLQIEQTWIADFGVSDHRPLAMALRHPHTADEQR